MKITDLRSFIYWGPLRNIFMVKVETDNGLYGWGEAGVASRELALKGAVDHFREFLIGKDPRRIGALCQEMYRGQYFENGRILTGAISAIDIALYDIKGKSLGVPVYELLGGTHRDYIPCFATSTVDLGPGVVEDAKNLFNRGWNVIRLRPAMIKDGVDTLTFEPRESIAASAEWLINVREELGREVVLGIDYHHRLSVAEAASFGQMMPKHTLDFLEEPIRAETPSAYRELRRMIDIPFAIGEEFSSKWTFVPYIEEGISNYCRLDICNVGGFTEAMKVAGWAETHYIDLMPHNPLGPISTMANLHLAAASPNYAWLEDMSEETVFDPSAFPGKPVLDGNKYLLPTEPGMGIEFNEDLASDEFHFWEAPHWRKRDGSYTNW